MRIIDLAQACARRVGLNVTRAANVLSRKRAVLLRESRIDVVVDVGANWGGYGMEVRSEGYGGRIVSFEPLAGPFAELKRIAAADPHWEAHQFALGRADDVARINVSRNTVSSSLLAVTATSTEAEPASAATHTEEIHVRSLASLRSQLFRPEERVHLKLDVQGFEAEVLAGAGGVLEQVVTIESEISLVPLYADQPLAGEMFSHLQQLGFRPIWIDRGFTDQRTGHILQIDVLFCRVDDAYR